MTHHLLYLIPFWTLAPHKFFFFNFFKSIRMRRETFVCLVVPILRKKKKKTQKYVNDSFVSCTFCKDSMGCFKRWEPRALTEGINVVATFVFNSPSKQQKGVLLHYGNLHFFPPFSLLWYAVHSSGKWCSFWRLFAHLVLDRKAPRDTDLRPCKDTRSCLLFPNGATKQRRLLSHTILWNGIAALCLTASMFCTISRLGVFLTEHNVALIFVFPEENMPQFP